MSEATPDYSKGVMLCLRPDDPEALTIPGGIETSDIHCTLFYFGKTDVFDYSAFEQAKEVIGGEIVEEGAQILTGEVTAWAEFGTQGETPALVLIVDAPGLGEFRAQILRHLRPALGEDHQPYTNHDFCAHITVAYGPNEADIEAAKALVGHPLRFEVMELEWGTEPHRWTLSGDDEEEDDEGEDDDAITESSAEASLLLDQVDDSQETGEMAEAVDVVEETEAPAQMELPSTEVVADTLVDFSTEQWAEFTALPRHTTPTTDIKAWSGDVVKTRTRSGETPAYYGKIYAWHDAGNSPGNKTGYKFPHHVVDEAGNPGAAVTWAAKAALMLIDDSGIPKADYRGVYNHLAGHLKDAGIEVPDLGSDNASTEDVMTAVSLLSEQFAAEEAALAVEEPVVATESTLPAKIIEPVGFSAADLDDTALLSEILRRFVDAASKDATVATDATEEYSPVAEAEEILRVSAGKYDWAGIIIPEGVPSGDGRMIEEGALTWRELPLPLMLQTVNASGHAGAVIAGSIQELERVGNNIIGRGNFDAGEDGQRLRDLLTNGTMRGVSADIDSVMMELRTADGAPISRKQLAEATEGIRAMEVLVRGRIMGATATPFPAFQEASIAVLDPEEDCALVASGMEYSGEVWRVSSTYPLIVNGVHEDLIIEPQAVVASAGTVTELPVIPVNPPAAWFVNEPMDGPVPFTVHPNGRVFGLVAQFGTCHIGRRDKCVDVPRSTNNYSLFRNKSTLSAEGDMIATGPIIMDTVHPSLKLRASDAAAFYAHSGCAVADVALYENEYGIVAAGALRPDVEPERVRALRGSSLSGDWRNINGRMELVGVLAVNVPGFPVHALVASGEEVEILEPRGLFNSVSGEMESLVAAGAVTECTSCGQGVDSSAMVAIAESLAAHAALLEELSQVVRPLRIQQAAARIAAMSDFAASTDTAQVTEVAQD